MSNRIIKQILKFITENKNFILLWQGMAVSKFGTYLFEIALIVWLQAETGSAALIATVLVASQIPGILLSPFGGVLADVFPKNKILVISDLVSGLLVTVLGFSLLLNVLDFTNGYVLIVLVSAGLGLSSAAFNPASLSILPEIVPGNKLQESNSVYQSTAKVSELTGQGLGGILITIIGTPVLFIANGISFFLSAFSEMFIIPQRTEDTVEPATKFKWRDLINDISEGFRYSMKNENVKKTFYVITVYHFFLSPFPVLLPFYISETLNLSSSWLGILLAVLSIGTIAGLSFAGTEKGKISDGNSLIYLMLSTSGIFILLGLIPHIITGILSLGLLGFVVGIIVVNLYTYLQHSIDKKIQGRVFGLLNTVTNSSFPLGIAIYGFAIDVLRKTYSYSGLASKVLFLFSGLFLLVFSVGLYKRLKINWSFEIATKNN